MARKENNMNRRLFCTLSPFTYKLSICKCRIMRHMQNLRIRSHFAKEKSENLLPVIIYRHNSLIRRKLGNVNMELQENKAKNLSLAAPKVSKTLIRPGEIFSFWELVGPCTASKGYKEGLVIQKGAPASGIGGGMCQFTNLIHWMILHTDLEIIEHHHHDQIDLFPDYNRQIPFGTGTSIFYNYLDYRFKNNTTNTYQLITYTTDTHLCGEIRALHDQDSRYHIHIQDEFFSQEADGVYRNGKVYRQRINSATGNILEETLIRQNHARVAYDTSNLCIK